MEIRVLRYFLAVVREENITKAAELLHITQPTLSRQIAQMEEEMGIKVFDRSTRKIVLTNEGRLLRRRAEEILELVDKTERELSEQEDMVEGTVSIGCGDLAAVQLLPELIRSFHERYPAVTFDLHTATADYTKERMDRGITDIGLLLEPIDKEKYDFIRLKDSEQWVVVMAPDSPLAQLDEISPQSLRGLPLILPHRTNIQNELARWFGDDFDESQVLITSNLPSNSAIMVQAGLAYAIIVKGSISLGDPGKIVYRPLSPNLTASCVIAWKRKQPFSPATEKFIDHVKTVLHSEQANRVPAGE